MGRGRVRLITPLGFDQQGSKSLGGDNRTFGEFAHGRLLLANCSLMSGLHCSARGQ